MNWLTHLGGLIGSPRWADNLITKKAIYYNGNHKEGLHSIQLDLGYYIIIYLLYYIFCLSKILSNSSLLLLTVLKEGFIIKVLYFWL